MTKVVKEFLLDNATGEVSFEYDNNSTSKYNLANAVTATQSAQGIVLPSSVNDAIKKVSANPVIVGRNHPWLRQITGYGATDPGGTTRRMHTACGQLTWIASLLATHFWAVDAAGGWVESNTLPRNINLFKVGYESGGTTQLDTLAGNIVGSVNPESALRQTDGVGLQVPAGGQFASRVDMRVAVPPTGTPTAAAVAGGALAAQPWYYVVTRTQGGVESGPTAEFTATAASANLAIAITIVDTASALADFYTIYRSSAAAGTKQFLGTTAGRAKRFLDDGSYTQDSTITPPAASAGQLNTALLSAADCEGFGNGGFSDGVDRAAGTGTFGITGPGLFFGRTVACLVGLENSGKSVLLFGDSIPSGRGFADSAAALAQMRNFWDASFSDGEINSCNAGFSGATLKGMFTSSLSGSARSRLKLLRYANVVVDELGSNDLATGVTWAQLAAYKLRLAKTVAALGERYYSTTILPRVTTIDGCVTVAGQTLSAFEAQRANFNAWARGGYQVDGAGAPVLTGGTPSPYVSGIVDIAAPVEVDASNVPALNGGYWQAPAAPILAGQVLTGTPTATALPVGAAAYTVNGLISLVIKMTSGSQSGKFAVVKANTANALTVYGSGDQAAQSGINVAILTGAPGAGDTFDVYASLSNEGTHPAIPGHDAISSGACRPWLLENVINA